MKVEKLNKYKIEIPSGKSFSIETPEAEMRLHQLSVFCGFRSSGKTLACINKLKDLQQQNLADRIFIISPTLLNNKPVIDMIKVKEEDMYNEAVKESLEDIITKIEDEGKEWREYEEKVKKHEKLLRFMKRKDKGLLELNAFWEMLGHDDDILEKPKSKYGHKPRLHILLDDCQNSPLFSTSWKSPFLNSILRHRHIGAVGASYWILCQNYRSSGGSGLPKCVRENTTSLILFRQKDLKTVELIEQETGSKIKTEDFYKAYEYATKKDHGFLVVDFFPRDPKYTYRCGFNELIIFDDKNDLKK